MNILVINGYFTIYFCSVTEIIEGEEYEVSFESGGNNLILRVMLSPDFPQDKPMLKIVPPVIHAWINADGDVTSAPGLLNVIYDSLYLLKFMFFVVYSTFRSRKGCSSYYKRASTYSSTISFKFDCCVSFYPYN